MNPGLRLTPQVRVYSAFFVYSMTLGGIYPRLGDIQLAMGIGEGALGLALIGLAAGTLVSLTFASPVLDRFGYRRALLLLIPVLAALLALASFAPTVPMLFCGLFVAGLVVGAIEVIINVEADRTEFLVGRRIMNRAHAFWSFGFFAAGLSGGLAKQWGLSPQLHLALMVPMAVVAVAVLLGRFTAAAARESGGEAKAPKFATPTRGVLVLVAFTLSAMLLEGANIDWSVIYMRDVFAAAPFVAASAITIGALAQAVTRFFADPVVDRFGPLAVARVQLTILGAGALVVALAPHPAAALVGFGLIGVGTSGIFPLAVSAAAQRTDRPAAVNVAALAQFSFVMFLVGPPLLGFVAEHFGIRYSFGIGLPLVVLSFIMARALVPPAVQPKPAPAGS